MQSITITSECKDYDYILTNNDYNVYHTNLNAWSLFTQLQKYFLILDYCHIHINELSLNGLADLVWSSLL